MCVCVAVADRVCQGSYNLGKTYIVPPTEGRPYIIPLKLFFVFIVLSFLLFGDCSNGNLLFLCMSLMFSLVPTNSHSFYQAEHNGENLSLKSLVIQLEVSGSQL